MSENQTENKSLVMPIKVKPYAHQMAAFRFVLETMGVI